MILNIQSIKDPGDIEKERIVLSAQHSGDIGDSLIALSRKRDENSISAKLEHIYWIPNQVVKENDLVVIYTKSGKRNLLNNNDGSTTYFFYWGLDSCIDRENYALVLFDAQWTYKLLGHNDSESTKSEIEEDNKE